MPLARVGARTDSTTRYSYNTGRGQFPRTRIGVVRYAVYCAEGLHFSAFIRDMCLGKQINHLGGSGDLRGGGGGGEGVGHDHVCATTFC